MTRKFVVSAVIMFLMAWALSFGVHEFLLSSDYSVTAGMRPAAEVQRLVPYLILAHALFGGAFAWIYLYGRQEKPWLGQGARYGLAIASLAVMPMYLIYHVVTPVPLSLALKQIGFDSIRVIAMGIVLAWLNR